MERKEEKKNEEEEEEEAFRRFVKRRRGERKRRVPTLTQAHAAAARAVVQAGHAAASARAGAPAAPLPKGINKMSPALVRAIFSFLTLREAARTPELQRAFALPENVIVRLPHVEIRADEMKAWFALDYDSDETESKWEQAAGCAFAYLLLQMDGSSTGDDQGHAVLGAGDSLAHRHARAAPCLGPTIAARGPVPVSAATRGLKRR